MRVIPTASREDWLEARTHGIGGSDISAICGISKYKQPLEVWLEKTGQIAPRPDNPAMKWGRTLEPVVADEFAENHGAEIISINGIIQHSTIPHFLASVDRQFRIGGDSGILEVKTTRMGRDWKDDYGLLSVPDYVEAQLQWYLGVTGLSHGYVAVLIGGQEYADFPIEANPRAISLLQEFADEFWQNYVMKRSCPPIDGSQSTADLIKDLFPQSKPTSILLPPHAKILIEKWKEAKAREAEAKEDRLRAENEIKLLMDENEEGSVGEHTVLWKSTKPRETLDAKALKTEMPEIYEIYRRDGNPSRRFDVKTRNDEEE